MAEGKVEPEKRTGGKEGAYPSSRKGVGQGFHCRPQGIMNEALAETVERSVKISRPVIRKPPEHFFQFSFSRLTIDKGAL